MIAFGAQSSRLHAGYRTAQLPSNWVGSLNPLSTSIGFGNPTSPLPFDAVDEFKFEAHVDKIAGSAQVTLLKFTSPNRTWSPATIPSSNILDSTTSYGPHANLWCQCIPWFVLAGITPPARSWCLRKGEWKFQINLWANPVVSWTRLGLYFGCPCASTSSQTASRIGSNGTTARSNWIFQTQSLMPGWNVGPIHHHLRVGSFWLPNVEVAAYWLASIPPPADVQLYTFTFEGQRRPTPYPLNPVSTLTSSQDTTTKDSIPTNQ
jgi:hypothetical protein